MTSTTSKKLIAFASKQAQMQEVVSCIRHFYVDYVDLHLFAAQNQIVPEDAKVLIAELFPSIHLKLTTFDIHNRTRIKSYLDANADVFAIPSYHSSTFYRKIPALRRRSTIVHLTDGVGDLFSMWDLQRAVIAKSNVALLRSALVIPQLRFCRADLEFNLFYPLKSPYSRRSFRVDPFPLIHEKRKLLDDLIYQHRPRTLIIEGFGVHAEEIAAGVGIDSYIATKRDGGVIIDGRIYLHDSIVCAEEVLEVMRPEVVVGCPSTSLIVARWQYDNLPVFCITSPTANRVRGLKFNGIFHAYAYPFGVSFADSEEIDQQLAVFRKSISKFGTDHRGSYP